MIPGNTKQENNGGEKGTSWTAAGTGQGQVSTPTISLPKGSGAIRGIGEKFSGNPATGTVSLSVPICTSLGRSDLYPKLSLGYDSGSGNDRFGVGLVIKQLGFSRDRSIPLRRSLINHFFWLAQRPAFLEWRLAASC